MSATAERSDDDTRKVARYRKIEVRTWGDRRFRQLSKIPPCGQGLWLYLLTGPETGPLPGLIRAGRAGLAEGAGDWSTAAFDAAFAELEQRGMAFADWNARLVWLPRGLEHNPPDNPNIVTRWGIDFDLVPECALRWRWLEALQEHCQARGENFAEAFDKAFGAVLSRGAHEDVADRIDNGSPNGSGNGIDNGSGNPCRNQDQEQEQEQEQEREQDPAAASRPQRARAKPRPRSGFDPLTVALPKWLAPELWTRWAEHRRTIKKPLTEEGARLCLQRLAEFRAGGVDPERAIEESILARWQGLFEPDVPRGHRGNGARGPPTQDELLERNRAVAAKWAADKRAQADTEDDNPP